MDWQGKAVPYIRVATEWVCAWCIAVLQSS